MIDLDHLIPWWCPRAPIRQQKVPEGIEMPGIGAREFAGQERRKREHSGVRRVRHIHDGHGQQPLRERPLKGGDSGVPSKILPFRRLNEGRVGILSIIDPDLASHPPFDHGRDAQMRGQPGDEGLNARLVFWCQVIDHGPRTPMVGAPGCAEVSLQSRDPEGWGASHSAVSRETAVRIA